MYLIIAIIPKQFQSPESKHTTKTQHCLAQHLAQAEGSRSGETFSPRRDVLAQASPLRLGEGSNKAVGAHAGSRLGETLLAWARCSLKRRAGRLGDLFAQKGLGESLFVSPRQD